MILHDSLSLAFWDEPAAQICLWAIMIASCFSVLSRIVNDGILDRLYYIGMGFTCIIGLAQIYGEGQPRHIMFTILILVAFRFSYKMIMRLWLYYRTRKPHTPTP